MYNDIYLKFADEAEAIANLYEITPAVPEVLDEKGDVLTQAVEEQRKPLYQNIDIIGIINKPTGEFVTTEDGMEVPVTNGLEGFHVNIRTTEDTSALNDFKIVPKNPMRVWA